MAYPRAFAGGGGGALTTDYDAAYGGKPIVPSVGASAGSSIAANLGNLSSVFKLGSGVDAFNTDELLKQLNMEIPGYSGLVGQAAGNAGEELGGSLPHDVINQILQQAAERGIATGGGSDSPNSGAAFLRAIGLNSLQMKQQGQENLLGLVNGTPRAQPFDVSRLFVTPEQEQEAAMARSIYASAPVPAQAAAAAKSTVAGGYGMGSRGTGGRPWWDAGGSGTTYTAPTLRF